MNAADESAVRLQIPRLNLVLTYGIPPDFRDGVRLFTPSGYSRFYRVTQLRTDGVPCRESAGAGQAKPQGSSSKRCCLCISMDQLICTSLSHTHYWYEVGILKVPFLD